MNVSSIIQLFRHHMSISLSRWIIIYQLLTKAAEDKTLYLCYNLTLIIDSTYWLQPAVMPTAKDAPPLQQLIADLSQTQNYRQIIRRLVGDCC